MANQDTMTRIDMSLYTDGTDFINCIPGVLVDSSGNHVTGTTAASNYVLTNGIQINSSTDSLFMYYNTTATRVAPTVVFYNDNIDATIDDVATLKSNVVTVAVAQDGEYTYNDTTYVGKTYDIPNGARYYRINIHKDYLNDITHFYHFSRQSVSNNAIKVYSAARFKMRSDTAANWQAQNPILLAGEPGVVIDGTESEKIKIGDGVTSWNELGWWVGPWGEDYLTKINDVIAAVNISEDCYDSVTRIDMSSYKTTDDSGTTVYSNGLEGVLVTSSGGHATAGTQAPNYFLTDYIQINSGTDALFMYYDTTASRTAPNVVFYNNNVDATIDNVASLKSNVIAVAGAQETEQTYTYNGVTYTGKAYTIPAQARYYRINIHKDYLNDITHFYHKTLKSRFNVHIPNLKPFADMKILNLGDSIFGKDRTDNISTYLSEYSGATVYNCGFGGTRMYKLSGDAANSPYYDFDGINLIQALTGVNLQTGEVKTELDWTNQEKNIVNSGTEDEYITGVPDYYAKTLRLLQGLDMSKIDVITLAWGTNDYRGGIALNNIVGALSNIIDMLQKAYPKIRILVCTPIWRDLSSEGFDCEVTKFEDATLKEIALAIEQTAKDKRVSVLNTYQEMPLCKNTKDVYFDAGDGTHLNSIGNALYAHLINGKLKSMF